MKSLAKLKNKENTQTLQACDMNEIIEGVLEELIAIYAKDMNIEERIAQIEDLKEE